MNKPQAKWARDSDRAANVTQIALFYCLHMHKRALKRPQKVFLKRRVSVSESVSVSVRVSVYMDWLASNILSAVP